MENKVYSFEQSKENKDKILKTPENMVINTAQNINPEESKKLEIERVTFLKERIQSDMDQWNKLRNEMGLPASTDKPRSVINYEQELQKIENKNITSNSAEKAIVGNNIQEGQVFFDPDTSVQDVLDKQVSMQEIFEKFGDTVFTGGPKQKQHEKEQEELWKKYDEDVRMGRTS